jgi:hypothetical protein
MSVPGMTGGDQKPLLKYNAKTAKWHVDDKVVDKVTMLLDLENGESGWVKFAEGSLPTFGWCRWLCWSLAASIRRCRLTSTVKVSRCSGAASG